MRDPFATHDTAIESLETHSNFVLQSKTLPRKVAPMSIRAEAEENLRVIRSLMEKATVYRAISAPGALVGGVGAVVVATWGVVGSRTGGTFTIPTVHFLAPWLGLLVVVAVVNFALLARDAGRRGEAFVSPGMRLALRAMLPGLLGGGLVTVPFGFSAPDLLAAFWVLFYGISLLAASHFAPKSICWLGRAFFTAGVPLILGATSVVPWLEQGSSLLRGHVIMGATFGIFHLVYAMLTLPRREAGADS
jgi:hypothetical protein